MVAERYFKDDISLGSCNNSVWKLMMLAFPPSNLARNLEGRLTMVQRYNQVDFNVHPFNPAVHVHVGQGRSTSGTYRSKATLL